MTRSVLVLLTSLVNDSIPVWLCRELRNRGIKVVVCHYKNATGSETRDPADDFLSAGTTVDLRECSPLYYHHVIEKAIRDHRVGLIVQVGCEPLYSVLPLIREQRSDIRVVELFNDVSPVVSHFLFERAIDGVFVETNSMAESVRRSTEIENRAIHIVDTASREEIVRKYEELFLSYLGG